MNKGWLQLSKAQILDLDNIITTKRIVKLAGKEIDVSKIPSRVTLEIAGKSDVLQSGSAESFPLMLDTIVSICKPSQPEITTDWLIDNTSLDQLLQLIEFVLQPVTERVSGGKNEESPNR